MATVVIPFEYSGATKNKNKCPLIVTKCNPVPPLYTTLEPLADVTLHRDAKTALRALIQRVPVVNAVYQRCISSTTKSASVLHIATPSDTLKSQFVRTFTQFEGLVRNFSVIIQVCNSIKNDITLWVHDSGINTDYYYPIPPLINIDSTVLKSVEYDLAAVIDKFIFHKRRYDKTEVSVTSTMVNFPLFIGFTFSDPIENKTFKKYITIGPNINDEYESYTLLGRIATGGLLIKEDVKSHAVIVPLAATVDPALLNNKDNNTRVCFALYVKSQ